MRARGMIPVLAAAWVLALGAAGQAAEPVRVTHIEPALQDSLLVCRVTTTGLPGQKILSTLRSGLESAVEVQIEAVPEGRAPASAMRVVIQLSFDLWEEVFAARYVAREVAQEVRFSDLAGLQEFLDHLPSLPVSPLSALDSTIPVRLRVGLRLFPLAPNVRGQVAEMVAGEAPSRRSPGDPGQEASVSLGRLIGFFYRGEAGNKDLIGSLESPPFEIGELSDAAD